MSDKKSSEKLEFIEVAGSPSSKGKLKASPLPTSPRDDVSLLGNVSNAFRNANHPVAAFFHMFFKVLALLFYIFGGFLSDSYVFIFVVCILLLAFDFWTVKNISGRLLVGLRWWNRMQPDGTSEWVFESLEDMSGVGVFDSRIFWIGLYGTPAIWTVFFFVGILKFNLRWLLIVIVAITLSGANIVGYTKCSKDAKDKMRSIVTNGAFTALSSSAGSSILSKIGGFALGGSNASQRGPSSSPEMVV